MIPERSYSSAILLERPPFQNIWKKKIWFFVQLLNNSPILVGQSDENCVHGDLTSFDVRSHLSGMNTFSYKRYVFRKLNLPFCWDIPLR